MLKSITFDYRRGNDEWSGNDMIARYQDPLTIQRVLFSAKTIAIVGLSKNELRASYFVGYYLKRHGYNIIPVNRRKKCVVSAMSGAAGIAPGSLMQHAF